MANPWRGEVELVVDGEPRVMRLTLAALAELEDRLEAESLIELIGRFEAGSFRVRDLIGLLAAGLTGGGWRVSEAELVSARIEGGPLAAQSNVEIGLGEVNDRWGLGLGCRLGQADDKAPRFAAWLDLKALALGGDESHRRALLKLDLPGKVGQGQLV